MNLKFMMEVKHTYALNANIKPYSPETKLIPIQITGEKLTNL